MYVCIYIYIGPTLQLHIIGLTQPGCHTLKLQRVLNYKPDARQNNNNKETNIPQEICGCVLITRI